MAWNHLGHHPSWQMVVLQVGSMARRTSCLSLSLFFGSTFMYRGRNIMCWRPWFGGHKIIHVVIPFNRWWCLRCCSMTWRTSGHLFLWRPSTITWRSSPPPSPSLRYKSSENTYQFTKIWYWFVNQLCVLGVILAYNSTTILLFYKYRFQMTDEIRTEWELP